MEQLAKLLIIMAAMCCGSIGRLAALIVILLWLFKIL